jgi:rhodanese-related sulfurtransferase
LHVLGDGRKAALPRQRPLAVACATGRRAAVAASVLRRRGRLDVYRVIGGVGDLADRGAALVAGN